MCNWQQLCNDKWPGTKPVKSLFVLNLTLCKKFVLHKFIKQRIKYKPFQDFTEDRKKTDWTIIFYQICTLFLWTGTTLLFLQSSGKILYSNIHLKINWSGKIFSFPHNWIILIDFIPPMSFISMANSYD